MSSRRIMIFASSLAGGGAERFAANLATENLHRGDRVVVVTMQGFDRDFYKLPRNVERRSLTIEGTDRGVRRITNTIRRVMALRREIRIFKPDYLISISTIQNVVAVMATRWTRVKVIASERTFLAEPGRLGQWDILRKAVYRYADAHVAQTKNAAMWLKSNVGARCIEVIPNMVTWPIPATEPTVCPNNWLGTKKRMLLAVGSLYTVKGYDMLIDAFARISDQCPEWVLMIIGGTGPEPGYLEELQQQSVASGIEHRVLFPGRVGNIADWYSRADIFVLSSRREGFPNVLLEAMASGCPCVSFDCPTGPREIMRDGVDGILVPAGDTIALADALHRLMGDEEYRQSLGKNAVLVRDRFSSNHVMNRWDALLKKIAPGADYVFDSDNQV